MSDEDNGNNDLTMRRLAVLTTTGKGEFIVNYQSSEASGYLLTKYLEPFWKQEAFLYRETSLNKVMGAFQSTIPTHSLNQ